MFAPVQASTLANPDSCASASQAVEEVRLRNNHDLAYKNLYRYLHLPSPPSTEDFALLLARILEAVSAENAPKSCEAASPFAAKKVPGISLGDYLVRIVKYSRCSFETLVLAVIYVDRYNEARKDHLITDINAHKLTNQVLHGGRGAGGQVQRRPAHEQ